MLTKSYSPKMTLFVWKWRIFGLKFPFRKNRQKFILDRNFRIFFSNWVCIQLSNIASGISNIHKLLWTDIISYNIIFRQDLKKVSSIKFTSSFSFADWSANQKVGLTVRRKLFDYCPYTTCIFIEIDHFWIKFWNSS